MWWCHNVCANFTDLLTLVLYMKRPHRVQTWSSYLTFIFRIVFQPATNVLNVRSVPWLNFLILCNDRAHSCDHPMWRSRCKFQVATVLQDQQGWQKNALSGIRIRYVTRCFSQVCSPKQSSDNQNLGSSPVVKIAFCKYFFGVIRVIQKHF